MSNIKNRFFLDSITKTSFVQSQIQTEYYHNTCIVMAKFGDKLKGWFHSKNGSLN